MLLTDFSKAFDYFPHELIIAKLNAYGFHCRRLKWSVLILKNNHIKRIKINSSYSSWEDILFGTPHETILDPILFNIFLGDFLSLMIQTFPAMPLITQLTVEVTGLMTSFCHCKILLRMFFSGFLVSKWR